MTKRRVYQADLRVFATIYVIAETAEEADKKIRERLGDGLEVGESEDISGLPFDSPELPEVSFSPSMTIVEKQTVNAFFTEECEVLS